MIIQKKKKDKGDKLCWFRRPNINIANRVQSHFKQTIHWRNGKESKTWFGLIVCGSGLTDFPCGSRGGRKV
jgi:hypothetical protein